MEENPSSPASKTPPTTAAVPLSRREMIAATAVSAAGLLAAGAAGPASASAAAAAPASAETSAADTRPHLNFSLEGKSAIVTGAARGIGRAIAVALAAAGADVMGIDICAAPCPSLVYPPATREELDETGRLVEAQRRRFLGVVADIRDLPALRAAADRAQREFGRIDIAVANAAIQVYAPLAAMTDQQWGDVIAVNLNGTANTMRAVIPHMIPRQTGRIILISSGQGRHGFKNASGYAASKWAIIGLMKSAALELGEHQITVNCVEPGLVDTPLTRNPGRWRLALEEAGKKPEGDHPPKEEDVIAARLTTAVMKIPWMQPDEVAPAVVFLATDAANRVTGATYDATAGDSARYTA